MARVDERGAERGDGRGVLAAGGAGRRAHLPRVVVLRDPDAAGRAPRDHRARGPHHHLQLHRRLLHDVTTTPDTIDREIVIDNLLVRVHLNIEMSRPALRHGSLNSLFQVALYLPSYTITPEPRTLTSEPQAPQP